jgi:hypothetical protein
LVRRDRRKPDHEPADIGANELAHGDRQGAALTNSRAVIVSVPGSRLARRHRATNIVIVISR